MNLYLKRKQGGGNALR